MIGEFSAPVAGAGTVGAGAIMMMNGMCMPGTCRVSLHLESFQTNDLDKTN